MGANAGRRLAWGSFWLAIGLDAVALALYVIRQASSAIVALEPGFIVPVLTAALLAFPAFGLAITLRRTWHPIGWIFLGIGLLFILTIDVVEYAIYALFAQTGAPGGEAAAWLANWLPVLMVYLFVLLFLLFPDGRFTSPRWRAFAWITLVATLVVAIGSAFAPQVLYPPLQSRMNPAAIGGAVGTVMLYATHVGPFLLLSGIVAMGSLAVRYRGAQGDERQQIKWFAFGAAILALTLLLWSALPPSPPASVALYISLLAFAAVPIFSGVAILRYRLYDIDFVINRAVLFGSLAVFITGVYLVIVIGASTLVGTARSTLFSALAAAVVAIAFQPVRQAAQRLANRLVYGRRATPYEVLSSFSKRVAGEYAIEDVLPRMARIVAEGTGATNAYVWLRHDDEVRLAASWPVSRDANAPVRVIDNELPAINGVTLSVPVMHDGELLGALTVTKPRNDPVTPVEAGLVDDLAAQAGLVLRNARLIDDLRASRRRIVVAQDARAKALERNIHDGAQQQLVAVALKAGLAEQFVGRDDARARELLIGARTEAHEALESLRELAHGIFPPLLAAEGLVTALVAQANKAAVPTTVEADSVGRYSQDLESAVYFCCLEAIQNVAKYARASSVVVHLKHAGGVLSFSVKDDGVGFEPTADRRGTGMANMLDRLEALGGTLNVDSSPGKGTTVTGRIAHVSPISVAESK
jgi:signal transduction histidine kinase